MFVLFVVYCIIDSWICLPPYSRSIISFYDLPRFRHQHSKRRLRLLHVLCYATPAPDYDSPVCSNLARRRVTFLQWGGWLHSHGRHVIPANGCCSILFHRQCWSLLHDSFLRRSLFSQSWLVLLENNDVNDITVRKYWKRGCVFLHPESTTSSNY